jgi:hypothetical protein
MIQRLSPQTLGFLNLIALLPGGFRKGEVF